VRPSLYDARNSSCREREREREREKEKAGREKRIENKGQVDWIARKCITISSDSQSRPSINKLHQPFTTFPPCISDDDNVEAVVHRPQQQEQIRQRRTARRISHVHCHVAPSTLNDLSPDATLDIRHAHRWVSWKCNRTRASVSEEHKW